MSKKRPSKNRGKRAGNKDQQQSAPPAAANQSEKHEIPPTHRNGTNNQTGQESRAGQRATSADWAVVAFTFVLTIAAIWQGCRGERQIGQTDHTLDLIRLEQRAWLGVANARLNTLVADQSVSGTIGIRNSGNTPAIIEIAATLVFQQPKGADIDSLVNSFHERAAREPKRQTAVAPESVMLFRISTTQEISQRVLDAVKTGDLLIYVLGHIQYVDAFGATHTTRSCFYYDIASGDVVAYSKYNYMD